MFTKIETITPQISNRGSRDNYGVIYRGAAHSFNLVISEFALRKAKMVIGDGVELSLVNDKRGKKWILLDTNPNGYKLVGAKTNGKGLSKRAKGTFQRGVFKTTALSNFLEKYFAEGKIRWDDDVLQVRTGEIAFPLENKKAWF